MNKKPTKLARFKIELETLTVKLTDSPTPEILAQTQLNGETLTLKSGEAIFRVRIDSISGTRNRLSVNLGRCHLVTGEAAADYEWLSEARLYLANVDGEVVAQLTFTVEDSYIENYLELVVEDKSDD